VAGEAGTAKGDAAPEVSGTAGVEDPTPPTSATHEPPESSPEQSPRQVRNLSWFLTRGRIWTRRALILVLRVSRLVSTGIRHIRPGLRFL